MNELNESTNHWIIESMLVVGCPGSFEIIIVASFWTQIMQDDSMAALRPGHIAAQVSAVSFMPGMTGMLFYIMGMFFAKCRKLVLSNSLAGVYFICTMAVSYLYMGV